MHLTILLVLFALCIPSLRADINLDDVPLVPSDSTYIICCGIGWVQDQPQLIKSEVETWVKVLSSQDPFASNCENVGKDFCKDVKKGVIDALLGWDKANDALAASCEPKKLSSLISIRQTTPKSKLKQRILHKKSLRPHHLPELLDISHHQAAISQNPAKTADRWPFGMPVYKYGNDCGALDCQIGYSFAMKEWETGTCLLFVKEPNNYAGDLTTLHPNVKGSYTTALGKNARHVYVESVTDFLAINTRGNLHELGHMLGLQHMHTRDDANANNVYPCTPAMPTTTQCTTGRKAACGTLLTNWATAVTPNYGTLTVSQQNSAKDNLASQFTPVADTKYGSYSISSIMHYPFCDCLYDLSPIPALNEVGTRELADADRASINGLYGCLQIPIITTAGKYTTIQGTDVTPKQFPYHPDWTAKHLHYAYIKKNNFIVSDLTNTKIYTCDVAPSNTKFKLTNCANSPGTTVNAGKAYIIDDVLV